MEEDQHNWREWRFQLPPKILAELRESSGVLLID